MKFRCRRSSNGCIGEKNFQPTRNLGTKMVRRIFQMNRISSDARNHLLFLKKVTDKEDDRPIVILVTIGVGGIDVI
jgi:hypothetical protein